MSIIISFFNCVVFPVLVFSTCYLIIFFFVCIWKNYKKNRKWKGIKPNKVDTLNPDRTQTILLLDAIKYRTEGHCPCVPKHNRSVNTICPCLEYRNGNTCRCGLFVKEGV